MKIIKQILLFFLICVLLFVAAAVAFPFVFKDRILAAVKEEINKSLIVRVDFEDLNLSLFRRFPDVAVGLSNYSITGTGIFDGIELAKGELLDVEVDLSSFWNADKPMRVNSIHLKKPSIKVYVLEDGRTNYDIFAPDTIRYDSVTGAPIPKEPTPFEVQLEGYSIEGADIVYQDATYDLFVQCTGLYHRGKGNFTQEIFDLATETSIDSILVRYGGIPWLKNARTALKANFQVEARTGKYTLKENSARINDMLLNADGYVQLFSNGDIGSDLTFSAPQNDFKNLLSLIPNAYIDGFDDVRATGKFEFGASVKGIYNSAKEKYPAFDFRLLVEDATVQYPAMPLAFEKIRAELDIQNPGGNLDSMTISVPRFGLVLGGRPFEMKFALKTPISDPDINAALKGEIHLDEWAKAFPTEGLKGGIIQTDARIHTRLSYVDRGKYDLVEMAGTALIQHLKYDSPDYPPIYIRTLDVKLSPQNIRVNRFYAKLGESELEAGGTIQNPLAWFSDSKTMLGDLFLRASFFDLNEWMPNAETAPTAPTTTQISQKAAVAAEAPAPEPVFDRFNFNVDSRFEELVFSDYRLQNVYANGNIKPNRLEIDQAGMRIGESDLSASGVVLHMFDYLFNHGSLGGDVKIQSRFLNLNQFMGESPSDATPQKVPSSNSTPAFAPIPIPANIQMDIEAKIGRLLYTNYELNQLQGTISIEDQTMVIEDATAGFLGGKIGLSGAYDTRNPDKPGFNFKYDMRGMSFQGLFKALDTYKMMSPLAGFIDGNFNTSLIMEGTLGKDLMPDLNSLSARGFLETLNGVISGFEPFNELGNLLDVDYLKDNIRITNTKNWFEVKNGIVELKEFDLDYKEISMKISGTHSLSQDMNYKIKARMPRKLLEKNAAGAAASKGYELLRKEASRFGLNLQKNEFVNVMIQISGSVKKPKITLNLLGGDGETPVDASVEATLKNEAEKAKAEIKKEVSAKVEESKELVRETTEKAVDSIKTVAGQKLEEAEQKAKEAAKAKLEETIGSQVDSASLKKAQELIDKNKEAERIKKELEKFNPLKKKKEGGG
jgi:hypothetical protein